MFTIGHFFTGLALIGIGILGLKFNYQIVNFTGRQDWIESKLGGGSTYLAYKVFALLAVVFGLLLALGLIDPVLRTILSPFGTAFKSGSK